MSLGLEEGLPSPLPSSLPEQKNTDPREMGRRRGQTQIPNWFLVWEALTIPPKLNLPPLFIFAKCFLKKIATLLRRQRQRLGGDTFHDEALRASVARYETERAGEESHEGG